MASISNVILMYRRGAGGLAVLLLHPGGPYWRNRHLGAWSIPKGELNDREAALNDREAAARREFKEELGTNAIGPLHPLGDFRQRSGKIVRAFALEGDLDVSAVCSNDIPIVWPPRSSRIIYVPEIDRAAWLDLPLVRKKILTSQKPLCGRASRINRLVAKGNSGTSLADQYLTEATTHEDALATLLGWVQRQFPDNRMVAAGHRVVHGGSIYTTPGTYRSLGD